MGLAAAMEEDRNAFSAQRAQDAAERKGWRAEQRDALDELLPKATAGRCGLWRPPHVQLCRVNSPGRCCHATSGCLCMF